MTTHLELIDRDIAEKHLLKHPFYLAWTRGELTTEALADYAKQYYHHVAAFPTYLSAVHAGSDDQPTRKLLLTNLVDEEAGFPNHPELWKKFAEGLNVFEQDIAASSPQPETARLIGEFRAVCGRNTTAHGLAALYAYESQIPEICESKIEGLKKHYSFNNPEHYEYFTVHIQADREHAAVEREMLKSHVTDQNLEAVRHSVARVLDALWAVLSGVCRRHAIAC